MGLQITVHHLCQTFPQAQGRTLMTALAFPGFYGRNWDAFWDAITGLVEMPNTLRLEGWQALEAHLPRDACLLWQCLERMQQQYPTLAARVEYV